MSLNIPALLSFLLKQEGAHIVVLQQKPVLLTGNMEIFLEPINTATQMCQIKITSSIDNQPHNTSIFIEPMKTLEAFLGEFYAMIQKNIFLDSNDYIRENGFHLRKLFLDKIRNCEEAPHLDADARFMLPVCGRPAFVQYSSTDGNSPVGVVQLHYYEMVNGKKENQTIFFFTPEEVARYPLIKEIVIADFHNKGKDNLTRLGNPAIEYFLLNEKMNGEERYSKKPKV